MAEFAKLISDLLLYQELDRTAGRDSIDATEVARLKGLVTEVADTVGPALVQIPVTFRQYTVHDIRHCRNVIARMGDIIPAETREKLNALEITFLLLSVLLHDVGMVVSDHEKSETLPSESFRRFKEEGHADRSKAIEEARSAGNEPRARAIEDALLAEYYRRLHPERVRQFMDGLLAGKLRYQEVDFADDLARLCESHAWGVEESNDARNPEKAVARLDDNIRLYGVRVNLQYLACILRIADILDFDRSRTPLVVFQHLDFTEDRSWEEWNKHLQVKGWEITEKQVAFDIRCTHPVFYVAIHEFLGWIDDELRECRHLVENKPQVTADRYKLFLPQVVDRHKVRMADPSYVAGAFRFQLEYENILTLLMDKSLYPDPSLFLRELLQNALDACRRKEAAMEVAGLKKFYKPRIAVWDLTDDPKDPRVVFQDNGIGMSQRIVEQYFLRVGRSYYRSPEFDAERQRLGKHGKELDACSQFGIGILSCFLVGDRFEVETYQEGHEPLQIIVEGPTKYFVIRKLSRAEPIPHKPSSDVEDGPPKRSGTRISVHFRLGEKVNVWSTLNLFAANVDYPINVHRPDRKKPLTIQALRWERADLVQDSLFRCSIKTVKLPALKDALIPSVIPFSRWSLSSHIRGCSWLWLLRGPNGQPTSRSGFLEVGEGLRITGIAAIVRELDFFHRENFLYCEWSDKLRELAEKKEVSPIRDSIIESWLGLSEDDKKRLDEVISNRSYLFDHGSIFKYGAMFEHWSEQHEVVQAFLNGSIEWADRPISFIGFGGGEEIHSDEEKIALNSILLPAGIVEWSPAHGRSNQRSTLPLLGGYQVDIRGPKAPHPAAHRLFIPAEEAREFQQSYLEAVLLHGVDLITKYGITPDWRRWFCRLAHNAMLNGLNQAEFAGKFGNLVDDACGLAVRLENNEIVYRSRAQIKSLFALDHEDPINRLLAEPVDFGSFSDILGKFFT